MDADPFETRCAEHRRPLLAYAYMACRDLSLAEDIVQETLAIAVQKRGQYFPEADFGAWLVSIARNVWYRERERRGVAARAARFLEANAPLFFDPQDYEEVRWERERAALRGCLKKLGADDRRLLQDHFERGLAYASIAQALGRSLAWVKVRMFRLRAGLLACVRAALGGEAPREA